MSGGDRVAVREGTTLPTMTAPARPWLNVFAKLDAYWTVALTVATLAFLYQRMPGSQGFPLDDGYISLHSAQVLHWGKDPNYPGVPALAGITNAPYVLLLYALLFVLPPLTALHTACWLGVFCYGTGLVALSKAFRVSRAGMLGVIIVGTTAGKAAYQLLNGVETGMALGLTAWMLALAKRNTTWGRSIAAVLCGLSPFLRPELMALSVLVLVGIACRDYAEHGNLARTVRHCLPLLLIATAAASPWLVWYGVSTGKVIPQSIEAKRLFFAEGCTSAVNRWHLAWGAVRSFVSAIGILVLSLVFLLRSNLERCALGFAAVFFIAYYERLPGALFHNGGRYMYVLVPILIFGLASGLGDQSRWVRRSAYLLLGLACVQDTMHFQENWRQFVQERDRLNASLSSVAEWGNTHLPSTTTLLIHDAGYLSYATRFHLIDFVGLKTPSSIELNRQYTYSSCGVGRKIAIDNIARSSKADYLVMLETWDRAVQVTTGLKAIGWKLDELFANEEYHVYHLTPPTTHGNGKSFLDSSHSEPCRQTVDLERPSGDCKRTECAAPCQWSR